MNLAVHMVRRTQPFRPVRPYWPLVRRTPLLVSFPHAPRHRCGDAQQEQRCGPSDQQHMLYLAWLLKSIQDVTRDVMRASTPGRPAPNHGKPLPKTDAGAVCVQYVRCSKPSCRCARGELHGPYAYRFWREDGRLRKRYIPPADVAAVQAACSTRRLRQALHRMDLQDGTQTWRALAARVREVLGDAETTQHA